MKILAIMGSPHKGNGYKIVQKIEQELKTFGDIDFKYIFLSDIDFKLCKGCFTCFSRGEHLCPLKDDKEKIEQEILLSDGIILSSPGYSWNVSALMKNFIDRFAYALHRPKLFKQSLMLVANGGSGVKKTIKALSLALCGGRISAKLGIISTPWEATPAYALTIQKQIKLKTHSFFHSMADKNTHTIELGNLIWFNLFKKLSSISKETIPADYEYYKDKSKYFYATRVSYVLSTIARLIAAVAVKSMKKQVQFK
jgi:NAD(P)H-dependent FMN reductase